MIRRLLQGLAVLAAGALAACAPPGPSGVTASGAPVATWAVPPGPGPALTPLTFAAVPGWNGAEAAAALPGFLADCARLRATPTQPLGGAGVAAILAGKPAAWDAACAAAAKLPAQDRAAARHFFETYTTPYGASSDGSAIGLFTGYYEPEVDGSLTETSVYRFPIYRRPPGLRPGGHTYTRVEIDHGALAHRGLELAWLRDPVDAFFLQVQGAGRIRLADGHTLRVTYDGQNGAAYVPIGRILAERGDMKMSEVSLTTIRAWLETHPTRAASVMEENPSYVFFRTVRGLTANEGAPSAFGPPLMPQRSAAIDRAFVPFATPIWLNTTDPTTGKPWQHLLMAQDLGGAIRGPVRADIFFGWGKPAEALAGRMRAPGTAILLLPRPAAAVAS